MKQMLAVACLLLTLAAAAAADSLWSDTAGSPYSPRKSYKVGDIVNLIVLESSTAKNLSGSNSSVRDDLSTKLTHTLARLAPVIGTNLSVAGNAANNYTGSGSTNRGSNVTARIAAWVTEVLANGNLRIKGEHKVEVNDEQQKITITGLVRPQDISGANTIYSYQVANAELSIKGEGSVADAGAPGWLTRLFNWIF
jgi:flagellar L-ring protein FlgH